MLIDFSTENFRSIRDKQTLTLVASASDKTSLESNLADTGIRSAPKAAKSAVIYGANASGKSNLILALNYMRGLIAESSSIKPGNKFNMQPFLLDAETASNKIPTSFEATFLIDGIRYQYGFSMNVEKIVGEWLLVYLATKPQEWFHRKFDAETGDYQYSYSSYFTGQKKQWQEATRPNTLFLSTAAHLNSEQLIPIYNWFVNELVVSVNGGFSPDYTIRQLENITSKNDIVDFLVSADISISDIFVAHKKGLQQKINFNLDGQIETSSEERELEIPHFIHKVESYSAAFELNNESLGTQKIFSIAGPLLDILKRGRVFVVDELNNSLHPLLVRHLVEYFHHTSTNPNNAQLIFTTHDTSLLNSKVFRRDQIWFVEKDQGQATQLFPLSDFNPRKGEALEKGYLSGRYGAVPFFDDEASW